MINGEAVDPVFGNEGADWHWQDGGPVRLEKGDNSIRLHDLTGFEGRCDAICLVKGRHAGPPPCRPVDALEAADGGEYYFVVVGGGVAGICSAVSAARLGCKVALVHNRFVLGGNNSSEVRVGLSGNISGPISQVGRPSR